MCVRRVAWKPRLCFFFSIFFFASRRCGQLVWGIDGCCFAFLFFAPLFAAVRVRCAGRRQVCWRSGAFLSRPPLVSRVFCVPPSLRVGNYCARRSFLHLVFSQLRNNEILSMRPVHEPESQSQRASFKLSRLRQQVTRGVIVVFSFLTRLIFRPASECLAWGDHCHATDTGPTKSSWKVLRERAKAYLRVGKPPPLMAVRRPFFFFPSRASSMDLMLFFVEELGTGTRYPPLYFKFMIIGTVGDRGTNHPSLFHRRIIL